MRWDQLRVPGFTASEKKSAVMAVTNAIRTGLLVREPCACCGAARAQGHHFDYRAPLAVLWLCAGCHNGWHRHDAEFRMGQAPLILRGPRWAIARYGALIARGASAEFDQRWLDLTIEAARILAEYQRRARIRTQDSTPTTNAA